MKKYIPIIILALACLTSCFKESQLQGYLGTNIYLQGSDTLIVPIGQQVSTQKAWLDNSTKPVKFEITNIRDKFGERKEEFFKTAPLTVWNVPYDHLTDTTRALIEEKLGKAIVSPIMINEVNGQLYTMPSTADCGLTAGDIFNVDVRMSNSKGSIDIPDYAVIAFATGSSNDQFFIEDFVNGICVEYFDETENQVVNIFPFYDQINNSDPNFETRRANVVADNGKESGMIFHKISDTPETGVTVWYKILDKNGKLYDPSKYANYTTTLSYFDVGIDRVNDPEKGMGVSFPMTPWPVLDQHYYMRGEYNSDLSNLDTDALRTYYLSHSDKASASWSPTIFDSTHFRGWYVRLRTRIRIYEPGTYELIITVPFTTTK
ncbi:MAG: DUF5007 domain-containing protein [Bacteroidales bacterium]|jgi:hypothetical protein|nr:DUF5007 domain-containing protein [Bacteroidales bacterium]